MASPARQAVVCILLILGVVPCAQAQSSAAKEQTASISGKVTVKGKAAAGIVVVMTKADDDRQRTRYRATTDDEGNYRINNISPGSYHAFTLTPALVAEKAQSRRLLVIAAGEVIRDVDFAMVRGGVITGRITNADGQPLIEENVSVISVTLQPEEYNPIHLQTDDRGIYRAFGLLPGKYTVSVSQPMDGLPNFVRETFRHTFYPSVTEPDKATVIEVTEGSETNNVDIVTVAPAATFTVSGRVIDGETGKPLPAITLGVNKAEGENSVSTIGLSGTNINGEFKLHDVTPGRYTLTIVHSESGEVSGDPLNFDVVDRDIKGLEMKTKKSASLSGMVVLEGSHEQSVPLNELHIAAWVENPSRERIGSRSVMVSADKTFKLIGLAAGNVHISFAVMEPREFWKFQLLRVEHNGVPQPNGISIKDGEQLAGVQLFVRYVKGTGAIRGQLKFENGELPPSTRIVIWVVRVDENAPESQKETAVTEVDSRGRFLLEGLVGGTYELRANVIQPGERIVNDLVKQSVTVADNSVMDVTVTVKLKP